MRRLRDLRIGLRLGAAFAVVSVLLCVVAGVALWGGSSEGSAASALSTRLRLTQEVMQVKFRDADFNGWQTAYAFDIIRGLKGAAADSASSRSAFLQSAASFRQELGVVQHERLTGVQSQAVQTAAGAFAQFMNTDNRVIALYRAGGLAAQRQANSLVLGQEITLFTQVSNAVDRLVSSVAAQGKQDSAQAQSTQATARTVTLVVALIALLTAVALAFAIIRSIVRPLSLLLGSADRLAEGDVDQEVEVGARDELGQTASAFQRMIDYLKGMAGAAARIADGDLTVDVEPKSKRDALGVAFKTMTGNLRSLIGEVTSTAGSVGAASQQMSSTSEETGRATGEIAHAIGDVAQGAERQVQMIETTRHSAEDVTRAVAESAENAQQAAEVAQETRKIAQDGIGAAEQANEAMNSVRDSSQEVTEAISGLAAKSEQIGAIVATITGIAEQTNLLALNAAIEAARAGEQGRGFAVVAEEVRKLAEDSQHAAQEISVLIGAIQGETTKAVSVVKDGAQRTEDGAGVVEKTREAFKRIESSVDDMTARIEQIAAGSQQIAASAASMQENIGEVAAVAEQSSASTEEVSASTEQTSASAQEIAASAQELSGQAEELNRLVARFKTAA